MPLGYDSEQRVVNAGDTAPLYAFLYDDRDQPVSSDDLVAVEYTIEKPDGSRIEGEPGEVQDDGTGFLLFTDTDQQGEYRVVAKFIFVNGEVRSTRTDFQVADPFNPPIPTDEQLVADKVWNKIEDCFDSEDGGPWMRDMTLQVFTPNRIPDFIDEAVFDINITNPPTEITIGAFTIPDPDGHYHDLPLIVQGTFLAVVRHLMRSYTEQPLPQGGQVTYEDRRDYLQRWGTIYQIEAQLYDHWVKMWKRKFFLFGQSKILVASKAGRLLPAPLRSRNIGRGYY
jgi:hypothetical protein